MRGDVSQNSRSERTRLTVSGASADPTDDVGMDLRSYVPFYLVAIANRWTATSSRTYLRRFGIGIVEWRIISSLGAEGTASSLDVVNLTGSDPALISKAMRNLEKRGLAAPVEGRFAGRTKPYRLTAGGEALFREIRTIALGFEQVLLATLDADERKAFLAALAKLHAQLPRLQEAGGGDP